MTQLQKIGTPALRTMVSAYAAYYGREMTEEEAIDCKVNIELLQTEIDSRDLASRASFLDQLRDVVIPKA